MPDLFEYVGSIHIHSTYSDGTKPVPEIIEIAQEVGLDYIIITDHYTLQPLRDGWEGWHDNLLLLVGYEMADLDDNNHYLIFDVDDEVSDKKATVKDYVNLTRKNKGFGVIAHPTEERTNPKYRPFPWTEWDLDTFDGIEIWNYMSEWMENLKDYNGFFNYLFPDRVIREAPEKSLKIWDEKNNHRFVPGIGGIDVHAKKHKVLGLFTILIFPYKKLFKRIRTHILTYKNLTKRLEKDRKNVYNSLATGTSFISNYVRGDATGFRVFLIHDDKKYLSGSQIRLADKELTIEITTPLDCEIRLIKDGETIATERGNYYSDSIKTEGIYRIEAHRKGGAWIYSNPFIIL